MKWSFFYNSFENFHGKNIKDPHHDYVIPESVL